MNEGELCQSWKRNCLNERKSCTAEFLLLVYIKMLCPLFSSVKSWTTFWVCAMPLGRKEAYSFGNRLHGKKLGKMISSQFSHYVSEQITLPLWVSVFSNVTFPEAWRPLRIKWIMACCRKIYIHTWFRISGWGDSQISYSIRNSA
jgi:hypothetical protein